MPHTTTLLVPNLHCPSCVEHITALLERLTTSSPSSTAPITDLNVSLLQRTVTLTLVHSKAAAKTVNRVKAILRHQGGFVIDDGSDERLQSVTRDFEAHPQPKSWLPGWLARTSRESREAERLDERKRRHLEHCEACRADEAAVDLDYHDELVNISTHSAPTSNLMKTVFAIGGMTCASCTNSISSALSPVHHPAIISLDINLLAASGVIVHDAALLSASSIQEMISDVGFDATLVSSDMVDRPGGMRRARLAIQGMTCASCSSAITKSLQQLPGVQRSRIDALSNSGMVWYEPALSVKAILQAVEDAGFDAEVVEDTVEGTESKGAQEERTVNVRVRGVFCGQCTRKLNAYLQTLPLISFTPFEYYPAQRNLRRPLPVSLVQSATAAITYSPHSPLTVRSIIQGLSAVSAEFDVELVKAVSVQERSRGIQQREKRVLVVHFAVALAFSIPTFIIAIVGMLLLPKHHPMRMHLMQPVWGGANLGTIIVWVLATFVQFGVGRIFYKRAYHSVAPTLRSILPNGIKHRLGINRRPTRLTWRSYFSFGSMDLLVVLSTSVSYFASVAMMALDIRAGPGMEPHGMYFDGSVFLIMFILAGRVLESHAKSKATDAISLLGQLRPDTALLKCGTSLTPSKSIASEDSETRKEAAVSVDLLELGDLIIIPPGSLPPTDGVVHEGTTSFEESSLTGESRPVKKFPGDVVYTGTTNLSSPITMRVTALSSDTMLERIISAVSDASARKAPIEKLAESITGVFVPSIIYLALTVLAIWLGLALGGKLPADYFATVSASGDRVFFAFQFCIAVLVVACPCGLGLAVPTANAVGAGMAASAGVLASKGGEAFLAATKVTTIVFDKTGTITQGDLITVTDHLFTEHADDRQSLLAAVRAIEAQSTHPLAAGIVKHITVEARPGVTDQEEFAGKGVTARSDGFGSIWVGNEAMMWKAEAEPLSAVHLATLEAWKAEAKSVVLVAVQRPDCRPRIEAAFALSDALRPSAIPLIHSLRAAGYKTMILSGDDQVTANAVGRMVCVDEVRAGVSPEGKASVIREIQSRSKSTRTWLGGERKVREVVMFVGDGLNDSVALTAADCGVAMGHGSQATLASADFVLLNSNLASLLTLIRLSKKVYRRQYFNLGWAFLFNLVCLPFAAGAFYAFGKIRLPPVWAALAMALSSTSVVASSLAMRWGI